MITRDFVLAGRAIFTVAKAGGGHYTFRILKRKAFVRQLARFSEVRDAYFAFLLAGPCNTSSYVYLGMVDPETLALRLTEKSKMLPGSVPVKTLVWALARVRNNDGLPTGWSILHAGRCGRCGRTLTHPESCESGFGPECVKIVVETK
jgi:hypothetical protein